MSTPEASLSAERTVLGVLLRWPELLTEVDLRPDEFDDLRHQVILTALRSLSPRPVTLVTLGEALLASGNLLAAGGPAYLVDLREDVGTSVGLAHHAAIVRAHAQRRALAQLGADLVAWGRDPGREPADVVADVERRLVALAQHQAARGRDMPELVSAVMDDLHARMAGRQPGRRTGLDELDELTLGLRGDELVVLAARPGMGKSALALAVARGVAAPGCAVAYVSLEMSGEALTQRLVAMESHASLRVVSNRLNPGELRRVTEAAAVIHDLPIRIFDGPRLTIDAIASECRRLAVRAPLGLVVIDHAGLVRGRGELRERMVDTSHGAKALAKELHVPVVLLAQLNRDCEKRSDKRPMLSDLKESGSLEEDADAVWLLYRDEYYHADSRDKGVAEVHVAKQREGPTGTARLAYIGAYTKFGNLARQGGAW